WQVGKIRDRISKSDPDRSAPQWQPADPGIKSVAAQDYAGHDGNPGHAGQCRRPWTPGRAFEHGARAVANSAFWEKTDDAPVSQTFHRCANGAYLCPIPLYGKGVNGAQKKPKKRVSEKFSHGDPVNLARYDNADEKRIEMADVICRQHKPAGTFRRLRTQHMHACADCKQQLHQQPSAAIGTRVQP